MPDDSDLALLIDDFCDRNGISRFEGDNGLDSLTQIVNAIGYSGHSFKYGTPIEQFLSDNQGAMEVLMEWIANQDIPEWKQNMLETLR